MDAVVLGGTGMVGHLLVEELLRNEKYHRVFLITRKFIQLESVKIINVLIKDLAEISSLSLELKDSTFFCCIGTTIKIAGSKYAFRMVDYNAVVDFAELAKKSNAIGFSLISAKGADPKSSFFYSRTKGEGDLAVLGMRLHSVTIFRPGLLVGSRNESRFLESIAVKLSKRLILLIGKEKMRSFVTFAQDLAKMMVDDSLVRKSGYKIVDSNEIIN